MSSLTVRTADDGFSSLRVLIVASSDVVECELTQVADWDSVVLPGQECCVQRIDLGVPTRESDVTNLSLPVLLGPEPLIHKLPKRLMQVWGDFITVLAVEELACFSVDQDGQHWSPTRGTREELLSATGDGFPVRRHQYFFKSCLRFGPQFSAELSDLLGIFTCWDRRLLRRGRHVMHQQPLLTHSIAVVALDLDIVDWLDNNTRRILPGTSAASPCRSRCSVALAPIFLPLQAFFPRCEFSLILALFRVRFPGQPHCALTCWLFYPDRLVGATSSSSPPWSGVLPILAGCVAVWISLSLRIATCVYMAVVSSLAWPSIAWMKRMSAPPSNISVAIVCRKRWQLPFLPRSAATT